MEFKKLAAQITDGIFFKGNRQFKNDGSTSFIIGQIPDTFTQNGIYHRPNLILSAPNGNEVEGIIATTNALVTRLQQVLVLVTHAETDVPVHRDDKLRQVHSYFFQALTTSPIYIECMHDWSSRDENQLLLNSDANLAKIP